MTDAHADLPRGSAIARAGAGFAVAAGCPAVPGFQKGAGP